MRHLQHEQLQKVHGEEYTQAQELYLQLRQQRDVGTAGTSSSGSSIARRLHAIKATKQPSTRLQKLLQENQASTLRIQPVFQMDGGYLTAQQTSQVQDVLVPGAIKVLQQYIKVRATPLSCQWRHASRAVLLQLSRRQIFHTAAACMHGYEDVPAACLRIYSS